MNAQEWGWDAMNGQGWGSPVEARDVQPSADRLLSRSPPWNLWDLQGLRGRLQAQVSLAEWTSWRVGGPADWWYEPADLADLQTFLAQLPADCPWRVLGLGSNVLVREGGVEGVVLHLGEGFRQRRRLEAQGTRIEAGAGLAAAQLARFCARQGLAGTEFLAGIPGTLGGALAMNAGAWGGETWSLIESVTTVDARGTVWTRTPLDYTIGYREVRGAPGEIFVAAVLNLVPGDSESGTPRIRQWLRERARTQPQGVASGGSVFRNPPDQAAARFIETAGLKGLSRGGAEVSHKHANFITHTGHATAHDIERLIQDIQRTVHARFGIWLLPEVQVIGRQLPREVSP